MEDNKHIEHHENWDAPVEEDEDERKISTNKEEQINDEKKVEIQEVKEVYQKDKYGNILITSLGDYKEPPKQVKGARAADMNKHDNYSLFKDALTHESDDDEDVKESIVLEEIMSINTKQNKNKKAKKDDLDGLDDILKEFGVEHKPKEEAKKIKKEKEIKPKEVKDAKEEKHDKEDKNEKENEEKAKKKQTEKKPQVKSHLNDAKREIREKQEALKKKNKKKGL